MNLFPVRCYTCNKVISHLHSAYQSEIEKPIEGLNEDQIRAVVMTRLGIKRTCCRRMFLCHTEDFDHTHDPKYFTYLEKTATEVKRVPNLPNLQSSPTSSPTPMDVDTTSD